MYSEGKTGDEVFFMWWESVIHSEQQGVSAKLSNIFCPSIIKIMYIHTYVQWNLSSSNLMIIENLYCYSYITVTSLKNNRIVTDDKISPTISVHLTNNLEFLDCIKWFSLNRIV